MAKTYIEVASQTDLTSLTETVETISSTVDTIDDTVNGTDDTDGLVNETADLDDRVTALENEASSAVTISAIYDSDTTMDSLTTDGYYIWTSAPTDLSTYLSSGTINDIWLRSSSTWSTYQAYDDCMATIAVSSDSDAEITYMKSSGSWIEVGEEGFSVDNADTADEDDILVSDGAGAGTFVTTIDGTKVILTGSVNGTKYYLEVDDTDTTEPELYIVEV